MAEYDVIIVGAGIIGTAIFEALSNDGMSCLLLESKRVGFGATGYSGAMVRLAHMDVESIAAAGFGLERYTAFADETSGRVQLTRCGHLYFARAEILADILPDVRAFSPTAQLVSREDILERFPGMVVTADMALFEPDAGFADPIAFANHQARRGVANGGTLAEATVLENLLVDDGQIVGAQTSQGRFACRHIVLACGAQTPRLLKDHDLSSAGLWQQKIQVSEFKMTEQSQDWPGFVDDALGLNGLPGKSASHYHFGLPTGLRDGSDDDAVKANPLHSMQTRKTAQTRIPSVANGIVQGAWCQADCYSDQTIAHLGPLDDGPEGLCLATGFSGGGFKMAPYAAKRILEILT